MKADKAARLINVTVFPATSARHAAGLSQAKFAELMGISVRTGQDWEQDRRAPPGAAQTLLRVAIKYPDVLREIAES